MKKTVFFVIILLNLICMCACAQHTGADETEAVEVTVKIEELLPKEVPDKMVFWFYDEEYIVDDAEVLEQLWGELLDMTAKELVVEGVLEGMYSTDCYYEDKVVIFSTCGSIFYFDDVYYEIGEALQKWDTEKWTAAGVKVD